MTHVWNYIEALVFVILFLVFVSGGVGWAMIYVLLAMAVFSVVTAVVSRRNISVKLFVLSGTAECGERVRFRVTVEKTGFCFAPYIDVYVNAGGELVRLRTSLIFKKSASAEGCFRAAHSGLNRVDADCFFVRDLFGFIRLKKTLSESGAAAVYPRYIEYTGQDVAPKMLPAEDDETEGGSSMMSGGLPGYDHREYAAGDPPKKVNYKLSAKRGRLMVRLDEPAPGAPVAVLIDGGAEPVCGDIAFALARRVCGYGGTVRVEFRGESFTAASAETVERLREWLAFRDYSGDGTAASDGAADVVISGAGEISV